MDAIKELFYGNIHPFERDVPKDSEGDRLNQLIIRHTAALKATLNEQKMLTAGFRQFNRAKIKCCTR